MAQHIGHLFQRATAGQQAAGHGVAQQVGTGVGQSGAGVSLADRLADAVGADWSTTRRAVADKDRPAVCLRALETEVIGDRPTGRRR